MDTSNLKDDLALAHALADLADEITLSRYQAQDLVVTTKPDNTPVTDADKGVETALSNALATHRPSDGIVGEEFGSNRGNSGRYWVIDPIDGTKNFMRAVPNWATLIALIEVDADGTEKVIVGVASAPALSRRWFAATGLGAHVRFYGQEIVEKKISVSKVSEITNASISYSDFVGWGDRLTNFQTMLQSAWRTRGFGDFWSHMLVAEGAVDIAIEPLLSLWDMAALDVIVHEAGGRFTSIEGISGPFGSSGVSTNGLLHQEVIKGLNI